jgi:hypothetical protein
LDVEDAVRLTPFKSETPKSAEKTSFRAGSDYYRHPKHIKFLILLQQKSKLLTAKNNFVSIKKEII